MTKMQWTVIGILGMAVIVVLLCLGGLVLGMLANPSQVSPIGVVPTSVLPVTAKVSPTPMLPIVPYLPSSEASAQVYARSILPATNRFTELFDMATNKIQSRQYDQLPPIIEEMQKARYSFWMVPPPMCAEELRNDIEKSMSLSIAGLGDYVNGNPSAGSDKLNQVPPIMAGAKVEAQYLSLNCALYDYRK